MQSADFFTRPRLPEVRPHTVHASSRQYDELDDACAAEIDDQVTPKASTAGLSMLAEAANSRLSRDDTARDMSEFVASGASGAGPARRNWSTFNANQVSAWSRANSVFETKSFLSQSSEYGSGQSQYFDEASPEFAPFNSGPAQVVPASGSHVKQVRSLGRRLSRSCREKVAELKDTANKHAPRMRRASTPHHIEAGAQAAAERNTYPPLSPSKRSAKVHDPRSKKFRSAFGIGGGSGSSSSGDRKDTPAPPAYGTLPSRTAPVLRPGLAQWQHAGGESARASAAAYRQVSQYPVDTCTPSFEEETLQSSRLRVGSLPSAADSGTDLPIMDEEEQSRNDSGPEDNGLDTDGDVEMLDEQPPKKIDFVTSGILPGELCLQIFEYLDAIDIERAKHAGPAWHELCNQTSVWRAAYLRKFDRQIFSDPPPIQVGGAGVGRPNKPDQDWRAMYQSRMELERNWRRGAAEAGKAVYLSGHTDSVYCLQFDEEKIITGSRDRTIRVWDINTFQCLRVIGGPNVRPTQGPKVLRTVDYPSFHLATASVNGTAYGNNIYTIPSTWHDASILCLQYDAEILVTGSSDSDLLIWDIHTYEPITRLRRHQGGVLDVALDSKHIISCSKDSRIIVWDRKTFEYLGELTGHRGPVNAVQLRGKLLVSASGDGIARLWDIEAMKLLKEFSAKERGLAAVEFSEDMKYVLAGGNDHITYKFEVETGKEVMQYVGHSQLVRSLWLDSANARVVSGSYDLDLRVYDFNTGAEVWRAEEWTTSWMLAAKSDYRRIVATSQDGRILVVDFGLKKGGLEDGQPIEGVNLLRGVENTNEIVFRSVRWQ